MPVKIIREDFLRQLQLVQPGLSQAEMIQQSDCFVFLKGRLITYNDEISCAIDCDAANHFRGAVPAPQLLSILPKLKDEEMDIEIKNGALHFLGKRKRTVIHRSKTIELPVKSMEYPQDTSWKDLPDDFAEAVGVAHTCASKDPSEFAYTFVHLSPTYIEATDRIQLLRYNLEMPIKRSVLLKPKSLQYLSQLGCNEAAVTKSWMHFRNAAGLIFSCRRYVDNYEDPAGRMKGGLKIKGHALTLPKSLEGVVECSTVFSGEDKDHPHVHVKLKPGRITVTGAGSKGSHTEWRVVKYDGPAFEFSIHPKLLTDFVKRHDRCCVTDKMMGVQNDKFTYITALKAPETKTESANAEE